MEAIFLVLAFLTGFFYALYFLPRLIKMLKRKGQFLGKDENKFEKPLIPSLGGLIVFIGFMFSLISILILTLLFGFDFFQLEYLLLPLISISLIALLGLTDDVLEPKRRFVKPLITLFAAIPAMALVGLNTSIFFPVIGEISLGVFYNILFIPLVIIFCANAINIMEGYNGLGSGMSLVISLGLLVLAIFSKNFLAALIMVSFIGPLLVLFYFNKFPAKIFPGNIGTLFFGSVIAITAILLKVEFALFIIMIPFFIHFFLYSRNLYKFKPVMWGIPQKDGTLKCPYKNPFGLMHVLLLKFKGMTEKRVVNYLLAIEVLFVVLALVFSL